MNRSSNSFIVAVIYAVSIPQHCILERSAIGPILLRNNHNGTFTDVAIPSGTAFNDDGEEQASMGADAGDYNHSGRPSVITTTFDDDVPALFLSEGNDSFSDIYLQAGLGFRTHEVGWGVAFIDLDNRGWQDIFIVNGHVYPNLDRLQRESHYEEEKNLYYNLGNGAFADVTDRSGPATKDPSVARGLAYGDLVNDGSLEIVVNNLDSRPNLLVNRGPKGHWLTVKLHGIESNRDGIGARVKVTAGALVQSAEVRSGCCFLSQSDMRLHFGLGTAQKVDALDVMWPSGAERNIPRGGSGSVLRAQRGKWRMRHMCQSLKALAKHQQMSLIETQHFAANVDSAASGRRCDRGTALLLSAQPGATGPEQREAIREVICARCISGTSSELLD